MVKQEDRIWTGL